MSKMAQKLPMLSMPDLYLGILEYKETQEAELLGKLTTFVIGWVKNTGY